MSRDTSENRKCEQCGYYVPAFKEAENGNSYGHPCCEHPRVVSNAGVMHAELARQNISRCREDGFYWTPHRYGK